MCQFITSDEYIDDDEPICVNCNDIGCDYCEDDGQPDEHTEWQGYMGGDEDPADYNQFEGQDDY